MVAADLHTERPAAFQHGGHERRPGARARIDHEVPADRAGLDEVGHQENGLLVRVNPGAAAIGPRVAEYGALAQAGGESPSAVGSVLLLLDVDAERDRFVARSPGRVELAHAGHILVPDQFRGPAQAHWFGELSG